MAVGFELLTVDPLIGCPVSYPLDHEALISEIISDVPDMFDL
jgi:hypothetical protein